jgi:hypothetical protein
MQQFYSHHGTIARKGIFHYYYKKKQKGDVMLKRMVDIKDRLPAQDQECFCKLDSGLYRVYWYDTEYRAFISNGALINNVVAWMPVTDLIGLIEKIEE